MNVQWFKDNGCEITKPDIGLFIAVYSLSGGRPCDDCYCKDTCPAWPKLVKITSMKRQA